MDPVLGVIRDQIYIITLCNIREQVAQNLLMVLFSENPRIFTFIITRLLVIMVEA